MFIIRLLIMLIPFNKLKIFLLNYLFKYEIDYSCKIGLSYIQCEKFKMGSNAVIGNFNVFLKCGNVVIGDNAVIGKNNRFKNISMLIEAKSVINNSNEFDLTESITIGDNCVVGGKNSEFWTHGFDVYGNRLQGEIIIKDYIYIGSGCKFNLGISIESNNSIGFGSVVTKSFDCKNYLIAGNPARTVKKLDDNLSKYIIVGDLPNGKKIFRKV